MVNNTIINGNYLRGRGGVNRIIKKTSTKKLEFVKQVQNIGRTITVGPNNKFDVDVTSISLAIKRLGSDPNVMKVIKVYPGTYNENIVPLTGQKIIGCGKVIINGQVTINTGCTLENIIIRNNNVNDLTCLNINQTVATNFDINIINCCFERTMNNSDFTNLNLVEVNSAQNNLSFTSCKFTSTIGSETTDTVALNTQESITLSIDDSTNKPVYVSKCDFIHDQDDTLQLQYKCISVDNDADVVVKCCYFELDYGNDGANEIFACLSATRTAGANLSVIHSNQNLVKITSPEANANCSVYRVEDVNSRIYSCCDMIEIDETECDIKFEPTLSVTSGPVIHISSIVINDRTSQDIQTVIDGVTVPDANITLANFNVLFDWYIVDTVDTANNAIILPVDEDNRDTKFVTVTNNSAAALDVDTPTAVTIAADASATFRYSGSDNVWYQV